MERFLLQIRHQRLPGRLPGIEEVTLPGHVQCPGPWPEGTCLSRLLTAFSERHSKQNALGYSMLCRNHAINPLARDSFALPYGRKRQDDTYHRPAK